MKDRSALIISLFLFSCGIAPSATEPGRAAANGQRPPERLWKAFPLQQQTTPRPVRQQPTTQPRHQEPAGQPQRSQRRDRPGPAPWLWILIVTGVGLAAATVLDARSLSRRVPALPNDGLATRRGPRRAAPRRISHALVAYRSGLLWLAAAILSGLAGWLVSLAG